MKTSRLDRARISARRVSIRFEDKFIHVMTKRFRKPTLAIGGWRRQLLHQAGWKTDRVYKNGFRIDFNPRLWMGENS